MASALLCSCASLLVNSGLTIVASTSPRLTVSPACTFSVTAPPEVAYKVGLTAATTLPSAAMSRTNGPRSTVAKDKREALTEAEAENNRPLRGASTASKTSTSTPAPSRMAWRRRLGLTSTRRSVAEVSRIIGLLLATPCAASEARLQSACQHRQCRPVRIRPRFAPLYPTRPGCPRTPLRTPGGQQPALLEELGQLIQLGTISVEHAGGHHGVVVGLAPALALDCFADARHGLHAIAGEHARRIDHVLEPRPPRQTGRVGERLFHAAHQMVEAPLLRGWQPQPGGGKVRI